MARVSTDDLDYLNARLYGRRSRVAEGARLDALCHLRNLPELSRAICPEAEPHGTADFQRRLVQDLVWELSGFLQHLAAARADLLAWIIIRFQVENLKVLLRGFVNRTPLEVLQAHLVTLPPTLTLNAPALAAVKSLEDFAGLLPAGPTRRSFTEALRIDRTQPQLFFLEALLDRGYFQELLVRTARLSEEDSGVIKPVILQEVNTFHLMLAIRGRFSYGLTPEFRVPLHVHGSGLTYEQFNALLAAPDLLAAATLAGGRVLDALPSGRGSGETSETIDPAALEALAWNRFLRLANRAFRRGHMGLGAVVGYAGIRRVAVANLVTLSEGIRTGTAAEAIRARLIPRAELESVYV